MFRLSLLLLLAFSLFFGGQSAVAAPGDLDPTFGSRGLVTTSMSGEPVGVTGLALQADGKLVIGGPSSASVRDLAITRLNSDGSLDTAFGAGGSVVTTLGDQGTPIAGLAVEPDGTILVAGTTLTTSNDTVTNQAALVRYLTDGSLDPSFGMNGVVELPATLNVGGQPLSITAVISLALEPNGQAVIAGYGFLMQELPSGFLIRFNLDGSLDASFGSGGIALTNPAFGRGPALAQSDGKILVGGGDPSRDLWQVARFDSAGVPDPAFGVNGVTSVPIANLSFPPFCEGKGPITDLAVQADGKIVVSGRTESCLSYANGYDLIVTRLNPDGSVDKTFAGGTGAVTTIGEPTIGIRLDPFSINTSVALQSDGEVLQIGDAFDGISNHHFSVVRYNVDGSLDPTFGTGGIVIGPAVSGFAPPRVPAIVQTDDKLVVAGSSSFMLARLLLDSGTTVAVTSSTNPSPVGQSVTLSTIVSGAATGAVQFFDGSSGLPGCTSVPLAVGAASSTAGCTTASLVLGAHMITVIYPGDGIHPPGLSHTFIQVVSAAGTDRAIEYYYAPWNHYFVTSLPSEIAALDAGAFPGWQRTGQSFPVYPLNASQTAPMCRFFSGQTFAPKSSHFYTPYSYECFALQIGPVWQYEGNAFNLQLLQGVAGQRACPSGSAPIYRLYNNGEGGAPNHRYTDSLTIFNQMLAQGWIFEGEAQTKVFACGPAP